MLLFKGLHSGNRPEVHQHPKGALEAPRAGNCFRATLKSDEHIWFVTHEVIEVDVP